MLLLAVLGGVTVAVALAGLYDFRLRRRGVRANAFDATKNRIPGCQQGVWAKPRTGQDPRR
jgi:hypothetical protein